MSGGALHDYWDAFYAGRAAQDVPPGCSAFAEWVSGSAVARQRGRGVRLRDARDSFHFAGLGHRLLRASTSPRAPSTRLRCARSPRRRRATTSPSRSPSSTSTSASPPSGWPTSWSEHQVDAVYGRFLLHSLEEEGRANLFDLASRVLSGRSGELLVEFRTGQDAGHQHLFGDDHYRAYLDPDAVVAELQRRGGRIDELVTGHGLAVYKSEDPHVARIAASFA